MTRKKLRKLAMTGKYLGLDKNPSMLKDVMAGLYNPKARRQLTARIFRK